MSNATEQTERKSDRKLRIHQIKHGSKMMEERSYGSDGPNFTARYDKKLSTPENMVLLKVFKHEKLTVVQYRNAAGQLVHQWDEQDHSVVRRSISEGSAKFTNSVLTYWVLDARHGWTIVSKANNRDTLMEALKRQLVDPNVVAGETREVIYDGEKYLTMITTPVEVVIEAVAN